MTESIKFGPEWLRNSVAAVVAAPSSSSATPQSQDNQITCRPVLSDHRYGREEMLSLCDRQTSRTPEVLPRFRRLYMPEWQQPLALQPHTEDDQQMGRGLGGAPAWGGTHIRPLLPGMSPRGSSGLIGRGSSIERGRGRGRGLYHGSASYARSTSLYDEDGRRTHAGLWLDRNGTDGNGGGEWTGSGSTVSPRKEYQRGGGMENWRKGTREEPGEDWRSSSNGTGGGAMGTAASPRDKWSKLLLDCFTVAFADCVFCFFAFSTKYELARWRCEWNGRW